MYARYYCVAIVTLDVQFEWISWIVYADYVSFKYLGQKYSENFEAVFIFSVVQLKMYIFHNRLFPEKFLKNYFTNFLEMCVQKWCVFKQMVAYFLKNFSKFLFYDQK